MAILSGSICLSDIPREQMKKIKCKDGVERIYVNVAVIERRENPSSGIRISSLVPLKGGTGRRKELYLRGPQRVYTSEYITHPSRI